MLVSCLVFVSISVLHRLCAQFFLVKPNLATQNFIAAQFKLVSYDIFIPGTNYVWVIILEEIISVGLVLMLFFVETKLCREKIMRD